MLDYGYKVVGLNRSTEVPSSYRAYTESTNPRNLVIHELGSNFDVNRVVELCEFHESNTIINFAAQSMVAQSWDSPWDWYETNCVWLSKLSSALLRWGKLHRFLHFSTPEVYGSTNGWIREDSTFNPSTPYAISRAAGDQHLLAELKRSGFPVVLTRAANVYGPFQQKYRIIPKALISAATNQKIQLHGGGLSERSFIYMDDVTEAILKILNHGQLGSTYHISTQRLISISEVVKLCFRAYDKDPLEYLEVSVDRPGKDKAYSLDSFRLRSELKWEDKVSLEQGIIATKRWVDKWLHELQLQPAEYWHRP